MVIKNFSVSFSELSSQKVLILGVLYLQFLELYILPSSPLYSSGKVANNLKTLVAYNHKALILVPAMCPLQIIRVSGLQCLILGPRLTEQPLSLMALVTMVPEKREITLGFLKFPGGVVHHFRSYLWAKTS